MKDHMIGFYRPSDDEFRTIWNGATFVLDANVLLNLYRYPAKASQDLLGALAKLSDRLWLPYQAALEYQRNRLVVVAEQKKRFADVRDLIEETSANLSSRFSKLQLKKRHSSIDVEEFVGGFEGLTKAFLENLGKLEEAQQDVPDEDQVRKNIDALFFGKVGSLTFGQKELDDIYKQGEIRYAIEMPPGYMDEKKEKTGEPDSFQYGGLVYKKKFGDLILWRQIIEYVKAHEIRFLVLLTDDEKDDWWWTVDSQGKKRIGPRPELVEEIKREGEVDSFYMYNSEQFLKYSKRYLQAEVSEESISQVREVRLTRTPPRSFAGMKGFVFVAEEAVFEWLVSRHPFSTIERNNVGFPDFVVHEADNRRNGFEVKALREPRQIFMRLRETSYRGYYEVNEGRLDSLTIVIVMETVEALEEAIRICLRQKDLPPPIKIFFGHLVIQDGSDQTIFRLVPPF